MIAICTVVDDKRTICQPPDNDLAGFVAGIRANCEPHMIYRHSRLIADLSPATRKATETTLEAES